MRRSQFVPDTTKIALDVALRTYDYFQQRLNNLRERAGILLGFELALLTLGIREASLNIAALEAKAGAPPKPTAYALLLLAMLTTSLIAILISVGLLFSVLRGRRWGAVLDIGELTDRRVLSSSPEDVTVRLLVTYAMMIDSDRVMSERIFYWYDSAVVLGAIGFILVAITFLLSMLAAVVA